MQLALAPDERRREAFDAAQRAGGDAQADQAEGRDGGGIALEAERGQRLEFEQGAGELVDGLRDQDGAGVGVLLQARRQVDRVADGGVVHHQAGTHAAHDHRAAVQADVQAQLLVAVALLYLLVEERHLGLHVERGADGHFGVVFLGDGRAKDGHDAIPDELIDHALKLIDAARHQPGKLLDQHEQLFIIEALGEAGKTGEIGKQQGNVAALPGGFQAGPAETLQQVGAHHHPHLLGQGREVGRLGDRGRFQHARGAQTAAAVSAETHAGRVVEATFATKQGCQLKYSPDG